MADEPTGFLGRWSRRKTDVAQGKPLAEPEVAAKPALAPEAAKSPGDVPATSGASTPHLEDGEQAGLPEKKALTLADAKLLTKDSDFKPFMAGDVTPDVRNAAMKQLFADPHFNVMDGLDIYIDDYSKSDPIPESMLRQMTSAKFLNLFDDDEEKEKEKNKTVDAAGEEEGQVAPSQAPVGLPRESANNPTVETVAQSGETPDVNPSQAPVALALSTSQSQPDPAGASQEDHAHTDLRLQPDHAAPAPGAGRGTQ